MDATRGSLYSKFSDLDISGEPRLLSPTGACASEKLLIKKHNSTRVDAAENVGVIYKMWHSLALEKLKLRLKN